MAFWCATEMLYFCGAPFLVRHRIIFCGALLASAPQNFIPPIRVFLLVHDLTTLLCVFVVQLCGRFKQSGSEL
jgi:hypothetical protein